MVNRDTAVTEVTTASATVTFDVHKPRYERRGSCLRCGKCCIGEGCEHLIIGDGATTCAIHKDPSRPEKCVLFPALPPIVFKGCGFYFLDLWDNGRIVRGMVR